MTFLLHHFFVFVVLQDLPYLLLQLGQLVVAAVEQLARVPQLLRGLGVVAEQFTGLVDLRQLTGEQIRAPLGLAAVITASLRDIGGGGRLRQIGGRRA